MPKATDISFVEKVKKIHESHSLFQCSKTYDTSFTVMHYAGKVKYTTDGFLEKNKDMVRPDLEKVN
jgi:myosin heavy subunit